MQRRVRSLPFILLSIAFTVLGVACGSNTATIERGQVDDGNNQGTPTPTPIPPLPTYAIGGTVQGLIGTLVLQNNGADDLTISADGSFVFATKLWSGTSYQVLSRSAPPERRCTISRGSGVVANADVTDVTIQCLAKVWEAAPAPTAFVSPNEAGRDAYWPQTAVDGRGNAGLAFAQYYENNSKLVQRVLLKERRDGTWADPLLLNQNLIFDGNGNYSYAQPQIAANANGRALVAWVQDVAAVGPPAVFKSEYFAGAWAHPQQISDAVSPSGARVEGYKPVSVAMDNSGQALISWLQLVPDGSKRIFLSEYRNWPEGDLSGAGWHWKNPADNSAFFSSGAFVVDSGGRHYIGHGSLPRVAMNNSGEAIAAYVQPVFDGGTKFAPQVVVREYKNGAWGSPIDMNGYFFRQWSDVDQLRVAMNDQGAVVIAWQQSKLNTDGSILTAIYKAERRNGTWIRPQNVDTDRASPLSHLAQNPQVAIDAQGNALLLWERVIWATTPSVFSYTEAYQLESNGSTWQPAVTILPALVAGTSYRDLAVGMDGNGRAIIAWFQYDGSVNKVFMKERRGSSGDWTAPRAMSGHMGGQSTLRLSLGLSDFGDALLGWEQYGSGRWKIYKNEYH